MQDRRAASLQLRPQLARAWFHVGNARRLVELYRDLLIPRAEKAVRTAEDLQTAGKGSVAGTIETVAVLHNFRLAAARARADHGQAVATLEAILGKPLEGGVQ
jgi:outer membrane protein TolC